jgi:non-ribosomal peptide synthetase component F
MDGRPGSGDALRELAKQERCTYFMAILATTGALLSAITGADDVVFGSPVANRQQPELEPLVGFFVNTVIVRVRLVGDPTFRELLARCRTAALGSLAHQETPLDRVVEVVNPKRAPGRNPLFQVNLRMQGVAPPPPQLSGLVVTRMRTDTGAARFDLAFGVNDQPGALRGYVEFSSSLFRASTAEALQATYRDLVDLVVAEPDIPLSALRGRVSELFETHKRAMEAASVPQTRSIRRRS